MNASTVPGLGPARAALMVAVLWACAAPIGVGQLADQPVRTIDALTLQWTDLERQKDLLQSNWRTDRPVLEQQLALLERESRELEAFLETTARQQDEVEQRRLELLEEQTRLEQEQAVLERSIARAALILQSVHRQLPPPLVDAWADELPRLDNPLLTATEKLQVVLELLGQLDDFSQKITLNETVMTMADGRNYIVQQVYLGLSHGWYVTADGLFAASGRADRDGWQWTAMPDAAPIAAIVDILNRRADPVLIGVPLQLNAAAAGVD